VPAAVRVQRTPGDGLYRAAVGILERRPDGVVGHVADGEGQGRRIHGGLALRGRADPGEDVGPPLEGPSGSGEFRVLGTGAAPPDLPQIGERTPPAAEAGGDPTQAQDVVDAGRQMVHP